MKYFNKTECLIYSIIFGLIFVGSTYATICTTHQIVTPHTKQDFGYGVLAMFMSAIATTFFLIKYEKAK